jgi:uncharacterized membrane protein YgcG
MLSEIFEKCFVLWIFGSHVILGGNVLMKNLQARCVLIVDSSRSCNGTVVSAAAEHVLLAASDAVAECETGGSIRLALIAVVGFLIIPIPLLLRCVDGEAGQTQASSFAQKHGIASPAPSVTPKHSGGDYSGGGLSGGGGGGNSIHDGSVKQIEAVAFEMSINVPDNASFASGSLSARSTRHHPQE